MRHLPNLKVLSPSEILDILDRAKQIKEKPSDFKALLDRKTLALLFQKTSTRTRVSFETAMLELGGNAIYIDWATSNFVLSGIEYETEYLSRNVSCIMARLIKNSDLEKIIGASQVPVINGCCEKYHPCQALTDIFTVQEQSEKNLRDIQIVYLGVQNNVSNSLALICNALGIKLILSTPERKYDEESADADVAKVIEESPYVLHESDPTQVVHLADFIYTDTWVDMQYFNDPDHQNKSAERIESLMKYQVNAELLEGIPCKIMHDMPIHDGYEITDEVVRDNRSIIFQQAENRLHAQKGLLWWLFEQARAI